MTKREASIVSAYTGIFIGDFDDFYSYISQLLGRPVFTHELPELADKIKELSKPDFMSINVN